MSFGIVTRFQVDEDVNLAQSRDGRLEPIECAFTVEAVVVGVTKRSEALQAIIRKAQAELDDAPPAVR